MIVEVRPVVEAPEEASHAIGGEPEHVARREPMLMKPVRRVVDAVRSERPLRIETEAGRVKAGKLSRQEVEVPLHDEHHVRRVVRGHSSCPA